MFRRIVGPVVAVCMLAGAPAAAAQGPIAHTLATTKAEHVVTVHQSRFRLDVYDRQESGRYFVARRYAIAVGLPAFPTPNGVFRLGPAVKHPSWKAPKSSWVPPDMRGKLITYKNPINPFVRYFVPVVGEDIHGVGIHGTKHPETIRSRASHGCIRMTGPSISSFVRATEHGDPVVIVP